jgi:hypothetical protein
MECILFHCTSFSKNLPDGTGTRSGYGEKMLFLAQRDGTRGPLTNIFVPYGRAVKRSLIQREGLSFGLRRVANDLPFGVDVAIHAKKIQILAETGYSIRMREGSLDTIASPQANLDRIEEKRAANARLKKAGFGRFTLPLIFHYLEIAKFSRRVAIFEVFKSTIRGDRLLPQLWRLYEKLRSRLLS